MKHLPFESVYRENFEVVEQRVGKVSIYPHTEQLARLLRALNLEFYGALPARIARVDKRADDFHKIILKHSAMYYAVGVNALRKDKLRLYFLPDGDGVTRIAIIQQVTRHTPIGAAVHFNFYGGEAFSPEIRLSGKRMVFAQHVLNR